MQKGCCRSKAYLGILVKFVYDGWTLPLLPRPDVAEDDGPKRRRARLNKEDFYKFGFTDRCLGCQAIIQGGETRPHNEHCRARLENEMRNTAEGQVR